MDELLTCPCNWSSGFGNQECDPQTPGANTLVLTICYSDVESITVVEPDDNDACATGVITDITLNAGASAIPIIAYDESIDLNSNEVFNEFQGVDKDESLELQGAINTCNLNFVRKMKGKNVINLIKDRDNNLWAFGWNGGMKLTSHTVAFGKAQGEFKGITTTFTNTTGATFYEVQVADVDAFLAGLITTP